VFALTLLYRELLTPAWVAALAALLYAIDDAHALPAVYLANRNALIACFFGVLSLLYQQRGRPGASSLFLALALCAAEIGLGTLAYLGAYALFLDKGTLLQRLLRLWPQGLVFLAWAAIYSVGGYGSSGSGFYIDPLQNPAAFLGNALGRMSVLLMGQWTIVPADLAVSGNTGADWLWLTLPLILALLAFFTPLLLRNASARYWALGSLLALVPVSATGPQNRLLFFVGIGAMGLLAQFVHGVFTRDAKLPQQRWWRWPALGFAGLMLRSHLLLAPLIGLMFVDFQRQSSEKMVAALHSAPHDTEISEQQLVVLNPPDYVYLVSAITPFKILHGESAPRQLRTMATGAADMNIERVGERTLEVSLTRGLFPTTFSRYYRSASQPLLQGETVSLEGMTVTVMQLNEQGDPAVIRYRLDVPLEHRSLRWVRFRDGQYEPWPVIAVGGSEMIAGEAGIFE
jgi:hypothetical protein